MALEQGVRCRLVQPLIRQIVETHGAGSCVTGRAAAMAAVLRRQRAASAALANDIELLKRGRLVSKQNSVRHRVLLSPGQVLGWMVALVLLNIAWRLVRYLTDRPLWGDEAMLARSFFTRSYPELLEPLAYSQLAPPGFLWVSKALIDLFGLHPWVMRLWPVVAGTTATLLFIPLALRCLRMPAALLAIGIMAASYYPLRHSVEFKPYSTDLLAAVALMLGAIVVEERRRRGASQRMALAVFAVVGIAAAWVSFPSIFVSGAGILWMIAGELRGPQRRTSHLGSFVIAGAGIVASFASMYAAYHDVAQAMTPLYLSMGMWSEAFPPLGRPWELPWWLLKVHTGVLMAYPAGGRDFGSILTFLLVCVGGWAMWKQGGQARRLVELVVLVLLLGLAAASLRKYPYGTTARTMLYVAPGVMILEAAGAWWVLRQFLRRAAAERGAAFFLGMMVTLIVVGALLDLISRGKGEEELLAKAHIDQLLEARLPGELWIMPHSAPTPGREDEPCVLGSVTSALIHFYALNEGPALLYRPGLSELAERLRREHPPRVRLILSRLHSKDTKASAAAAPYLVFLEGVLGRAEQQVHTHSDRDQLVVWTWDSAAAIEPPAESPP